MIENINAFLHSGYWLQKHSSSRFFSVTMNYGRDVFMTGLTNWACLFSFLSIIQSFFLVLFFTFPSLLFLLPLFSFISFPFLSFLSDFFVIRFFIVCLLFFIDILFFSFLVSSVFLLRFICCKIYSLSVSLSSVRIWYPSTRLQVLLYNIGALFLILACYIENNTKRTHAW